MQHKKFLKRIGIGAIGTLILGSAIEFYPFLGDEIVVREIQFCSSVICIVVLMCTNIVITNRK